LRFDDRLQTLLDAPVADARDRAVRWRQLADLLSRLDRLEEGGVTARALDLVRADALAVDEQVRAATLRGIAGRRLAPELLRIFAAQPMRIAAPLFAGVTMGQAEAALVLADADPEVRALVTIEPSSEPAQPEPAPAAPEAVQPEPAAPSISAIVDRIEQLRVQRTAPKPKAPPPQRPRADPTGPRLFEWESDASGHIAWVTGAPRGALVGRPLGGDGIGLLERQAAGRIVQRHPFVDVPVVIGDALDGEWSATGVPAFDPATGRFLGYRGLARRIDGAPPAARAATQPRETDMDALREMVHEIKTPLNAIIGFAEIIDGQYLGPAHRRYRDRAAQIVGQARQLLEAVEDLDFAAKLRADRSRSSGGSRLADLFPPIAEDLQRCLKKGGGLLEVDIEDERLRCALSPALAERLARRLLLSLCEHVGKDEPFRVAVSSEVGMALLVIVRPRALDGLDETRLVDPAFDPRGGHDLTTIGLGFALRLVRGLAKVVGGDLRIDAHSLTLALPALDS
jgi:hypothetical protein